MNLLHIAAKVASFSKVALVQYPVKVHLSGDGWDKDALYDDIQDALLGADVDISVGDVGIGETEYWGSRSVDTNIEVTDVTGDNVIVELVFDTDPDVSQEQQETMKSDILKNAPIIYDTRDADDFDPDAYHKPGPASEPLHAEFAWIPTNVTDNKITYSIKFPME